MADFTWSKPLPPRRRRSELTLSHPHPDEDDSLTNLGVPSVRSRQWRPIPRIASLDVLSAASIRSDGSQSSSHRLSPSSSPSPAEPAEAIWYQERDETERALSLEQMINALHYTMMTKPVLDPVPREYNSYILHLLEGYWDVQERLKKTEQELVEEKETKQRSFEEFTKISEEWATKEADFRAEIKRMELVLVDVAPGGVGAVVLARSGSLVDRSARSSQLFKAKVEKAKESPTKDNRSPNKTDSLEKRPVSGGSGSPRLNHRTFLSMQPNLDDNADIELSKGLRRAQQRQQRASKHGKKKRRATPVEMVWNIGIDSSEEEENQPASAEKTARLPGLGSPKLKLPRPAAHTQTTPESPATKAAIYTSSESDNRHYWPGATPLIGVGSVEYAAAATDMPIDERPLSAHPDVMTATNGYRTALAARRSSGFHRHRRDFSFDAVEDGMPQQALAGSACSSQDKDAQPSCTETNTQGHALSSEKHAPMASITAKPSGQAHMAAKDVSQRVAIEERDQGWSKG
ncbi:hypothetical protein CORC01_12295 [Colletotrichum orchidophilum]|uniref:Uncharacterized protein n=1 Tax=Colletotrichum orchidophilum TaxID=1209926 RepID=A0A1G4ATE8_9PEZI|nr:uncharacterized protein CORC01_12295 [Colletotrichum orchidophilum]OHE92434.1 hypothetical protein CORC01_12295 [Colletotrichum orchidophilum]